MFTIFTSVCVKYYALSPHIGYFTDISWAKMFILLSVGSADLFQRSVSVPAIQGTDSDSWQPYPGDFENTHSISLFRFGKPSLDFGIFNDY